jgi:hypothetical protein
VTPEQITHNMQGAATRAARGDLIGALKLCEIVVRVDKSNRRAFRMNCALYNAVYGSDLPYAVAFDSLHTNNEWCVGSGFGSLPRTTES